MLSASRKRSSHLVWNPRAMESASEMYCLSADYNRIANGVKVQLWKCDQNWGSGGQNFYLGADGRIRMHSSPSYCVVVDGDRMEVGRRIQLWRCSDSNPDQVWSMTLQGQIISARGHKCMGMNSNAAWNGAPMRLQSCSSSGYIKRAQTWTQLTLNAAGDAVYAVPHEDHACKSPWAPVRRGGVKECVAAAEALRPGSGCRFGDRPLERWSEIVSVVNKPSYPAGCLFYRGCRGGCGLQYNPMGYGTSLQEECVNIDVICQLSLK